MSLLKIRNAPLIIIQDDVGKNILPLLINLVQQENNLYLTCFEQPKEMWANIFDKINLNYIEKIENISKIKFKCSVIIDSINQMYLQFGWNVCLKYLMMLKNNVHVKQTIVVLHNDSLSSSSKLFHHLHHIASAIVNYDKDLVKIIINSNGKFIKSDEVLSYDMMTNTLKSNPIMTDNTKCATEQKVLPSNISSFKIEMDQIEKLEKYKLKLPYMSKINDGQSKVYYEPDAVDDWDEEDPDEDLDL